MSGTTRAEDLLGEYGDRAVQMNAFASAKTGLILNQTMLKVGEYSLVCVPYQMCMRTATLIGAFSKQELSFFQKFVNTLAGLSIVYQPPAAPQPVKIFGRCIVNSIAPMQGREQVGLVVVEFKPCPPDLLTLLGDYHLLLERLKVQFEDFRNQPVAINQENAKNMGYNNFAELTVEGVKTRVALFLLSSASLSFLVPMTAPELKAGSTVQVKLFFQSFQFAVKGAVSASERLPNKAQKATVAIEFSPELVDIIDKFHFTDRIAKKIQAQKAQAAPAEGPNPRSPGPKPPAR